MHPRTPEPCTKRYDGHCHISLGRRPGAPKWGSWMVWEVGGATVGPQGLLPGRVLQRFVEQIIDEDGVVLAVVDVLVICSDKFQQFLFFGVEVPQLQVIDRVAVASLPWRFHRCSSWTRSLTCLLLCCSATGGRCPCCAGARRCRRCSSCGFGRPYDHAATLGLVIARVSGHCSSEQRRGSLSAWVWRR